jgi:hypothetical protein
MGINKIQSRIVHIINHISGPLSIVFTYKFSVHLENTEIESKELDQDRVYKMCPFEGCEIGTWSNQQFNLYKHMREIVVQEKDLFMYIL